MTPLQLTQPDTESSNQLTAELDTPVEIEPSATEVPLPPAPWLRRLWGGTLVVVGYLLSPLCWWNDLVINLPLALGFGYLASRPWPDALGPMPWCL